MTIVLGAVAYDPKVVDIWTGFRRWLRSEGLDFDFVLYSHYEPQVVDLVAGKVHAAWNSPLAWLRAERLARAAGREVRAAVMRDTDQDLTSLVVVRAEAPWHTPADLKGERVASGAVDSPQATLIPLAMLRSHGVGLQEGEVLRFDVGVGLHGDHIGGERDAARALMAGEVAAACMLDTNHLLFTREGTLTPGTRVLASTPVYDHCNMTVLCGHAEPEVQHLEQLLLSMCYSDPQLRPLMDMEGLTAWRPGRVTGYTALAAAVDAVGFYGPSGELTEPAYAP